MTISVHIQAKAEELLRVEAQFFGVNATALVKAIIDKIVTGGMTRDVLQGVDVESYHERRKGRPRTKPVITRPQRTPSKRYDFYGRMLTVGQISRLTGLPASTVRYRANNGLKIEKRENGNG